MKIISMNKTRRLICLGTLITIFILTLFEGCSSEEGSNSDMISNAPTATQAPVNNATPSPAPTEVPTPTLTISTPSPTAAPTEAAAMADPSSTAAEDMTDISQLFLYDTTIPFNVTEISTEETSSGITVKEISYDAYDKTVNTKGKIGAYVVLPKGEGPFPCVLFFHWLGNNNSNKEEFLEEAKTLADQGIAGFLIDGYFPWKAEPSKLEKDKELVVYQVIEISRAIDYMISLPDIDKEHLGYVGHDYGAMFGSVSSGIDKRIDCYVFMAGMDNFTDWFVQYWSHKDSYGVELGRAGKLQYKLDMRVLDPVKFVKNAAPAKLFFQFAEDDVFVSKEAADLFYRAASDPKEVKSYDTTHEMESEEAKLDRINWIVDNLK